MIVTILQPSYVPWRGFFQQLVKSDVFVFYDDVQYDKHGWRNRNRIKTSAGIKWITIPVHSSGNLENHLLLKDVEIDVNQKWNKVHWETIKQNYSKCPYFSENKEWVEDVYRSEPKNLCDFTIDTIILISKILAVNETRFVRSSNLHGICGNKTDRLISILTQLGATHYISGPSAKKYIEPEKFSEAGIILEYINYNLTEYPQRFPPFDPYVSILDLIFNTGPRAIEYIEKN